MENDGYTDQELYDLRMRIGINRYGIAVFLVLLAFVAGIVMAVYIKSSVFFVLLPVPLGLYALGIYMSKKSGDMIRFAEAEFRKATGQ
ncbi:MAG: hypothetical protein NTW79_02210 [Candidatus Berkelbacteria bacterium]|nr:hypothetical protein [Candidatus Berkelbacteria bacterium]